METVYGRLKKIDEDVKIVTENGNFLTIDKMTKDCPAKHLNAANGWARKPIGKKLFSFIVKNDGTVMIVM